VAQASGRDITLLICDDHKLLTESLAMVVAAERDITMVSQPVDDPELAVELCRAHRPDVVLMDVAFRGRTNGFEATRRIKESSPSTMVIIMTASDDEFALVSGVEAGAAGFLNKTEAVDEVLAAIRAAAEGRTGPSRCYRVVFVDASTGTASSSTWSLAAADSSSFTTTGNWSSSFSSTRYLKFTFRPTSRRRPV